MFKSFRGRVVVIALTVGICAYYLATSGLKLGLDLKGGMHLVLEIDDPDQSLTEERRQDAIDRAERILRTRIDEFGVEEPLIQKVGSDRLIVELAGIDDKDRAKEIINQQAFLEWKLVLGTERVSGTLERLDRAVVAAIGEEGLRAMNRATVQTESGGSIEDLLFQPQTPDTSGAGGEAETDSGQAGAGEAAGAEEEAQDEAPEEEALNFRPFSSLLNVGQGDGTYLVEAGQDADDAGRFMALEDFQRALPRGVALQWGWDSLSAGGFYRELYILEEEPFLTGEMLEDATANRDPQTNQAQVLFNLTRRGGREFQRLTANNVGNRIAIVLDGQVISAPVVRERIGARGSIEMGSTDLSEASDLALVLRAGALPAPLRIMEERTVGPSLGQDSVNQGRIAGIVGIAIVILIMIGYYRVAGALAIGALAIYLLLAVGGLAILGANLSLPGIAGLVLSIGMAVDANVLIFERIREEAAVGRAPRTAVEEGFGNAVSAIVDANITTLITGLILFQFGTGPVQGFATTLTIGIAASFFSALYVTRTFFYIYLAGKKGSDPISI